MKVIANVPNGFAKSGNQIDISIKPAQSAPPVSEAAKVELSEAVQPAKPTTAAQVQGNQPSLAREILGDPEKAAAAAAQKITEEPETSLATQIGKWAATGLMGLLL